MRNIMKRATTLRRLALWVWFLILPVIAQAQTQLGSAAALRAKYDAVQTQLAKNVFGRPLVLESTEASGQLSGDIFAVLSHPFDQVSGSLSQPGVWCDVLMLHLNTKHCAVRGTAPARMLAVSVGRKFDQPLSEAQRVEFIWQPPNVADDYLSVRLSATRGRCRPATTASSSRRRRWATAKPSFISATPTPTALPRASRCRATSRPSARTRWDSPRRARTRRDRPLD